MQMKRATQQLINVVSSSGVPMCPVHNVPMIEIDHLDPEDAADLLSELAYESDEDDEDLDGCDHSGSEVIIDRATGEETCADCGEPIDEEETPIEAVTPEQLADALTTKGRN